MVRYALKLTDMVDSGIVERALSSIPTTIDQASFSFSDPRDDATTVASGPARRTLTALRRYLESQGVPVELVRRDGDERTFGAQWREQRLFVVVLLVFTLGLMAAQLALTTVYLPPPSVEVDRNPLTFAGAATDAYPASPVRLAEASPDLRTP